MLNLKRYSSIWAALALGFVVAACSEDNTEGVDSSLPSIGPSQLAMVATGGFNSPGDGVASPDGRDFYFNAFTTEAVTRPAIFHVPSEGGAVNLIYAGKPLESPTGLLMSCDGETLFIADSSTTDEGAPAGSESGAIYSLTLESNDLTLIQSDGIAAASGLAIDSDCATLHITGYNLERKPALFSLPKKGGTASETFSGEPLVSPSGVFIDNANISWVMDQLRGNESGAGALFSITLEGEIDKVLDDVRMGAPGGVSLAAGGVTAVIAETNEIGEAQLTSVNTLTGQRSVLPAPEIVSPAGIRTAKKAGIFIVVDNGGNAIFRAE